MVGIYLSGTGNTKHCTEKLIWFLDSSAECISLESSNIRQKITDQDVIVLGYPTQYSNAPLMVRDFIKSNHEIWKNKKIFIVNTMGLFSGDGTGCTARILKKYGAKILGGIQIKMPDAVCDSKLLKKSAEENRQIVKSADCRLEVVATEFKSGRYPQEGLAFIDHLKGLFGQRLWFYAKTAGYTDKLKVSDECISCGLCVQNCPMKNLTMSANGKPIQKGKCTMCYRCISHCPKQAITLLGKNVVEQTVIEKFIE